MSYLDSRFLNKALKNRNITRNVTFRAGSVSDIINDPKGWVNDLSTGIPSRLNNVSRHTLEKYGNDLIIGLNIARTPLNKTVEGAINTISLGKFEQLKQKYNYDQFCHLSLIVELQNTPQRIIIEKNEVIHIAPLTSSSSLNNKTEYLTLNLKKQLITLNQLIENTRNIMGESRFYDYSGLENNCQVFIGNILNANNLNSHNANEFLYQDLRGITKDLNNSNFSYVPKVMDKITGLASIASRFIGKGTKTNKLMSYMKRKHITKKDLNEALNNDKFLDFIAKDKFNFL